MRWAKLYSECVFARQGQLKTKNRMDSITQTMANTMATICSHQSHPTIKLSKDINKPVRNGVRADVGWHFILPTVVRMHQHHLRGSCDVTPSNNIAQAKAKGRGIRRQAHPNGNQCRIMHSCHALLE